MHVFFALKGSKLFIIICSLLICFFFEISFTFSTGLHVHVGVRDKVLLLKPDRHGKWQRVSCYEKSRCDACCTFHNGSLTDVI